MRKPAPKTPKSADQQPEVRVVGASFSGPMPPPSLLQGYEQVCPGAAERILRMAEEQHRHSIDMDRQTAGVIADGMRCEHIESRMGLIFGFVIALAFIAVGVFVIYGGYPWPGALLSGGGISVPIIGMFVRGHRQNSDSESAGEIENQTKQTKTLGK